MRKYTFHDKHKKKYLITVVKKSRVLIELEFEIKAKNLEKPGVLKVLKNHEKLFNFKEKSKKMNFKQFLHVKCLNFSQLKDTNHIQFLV